MSVKKTIDTYSYGKRDLFMWQKRPTRASQTLMEGADAAGRLLSQRESARARASERASERERERESESERARERKRERGRFRFQVGSSILI